MPRRRALVAAALVSIVAASAARGGEIRGRVVSLAGEAVRDAVVFVQEMPAGMAVQPQRRSAVMDQVNTEFVPHILPISVGTEVHFPNHDQIHHHVYSFSRTKTFEIPLYKGEAVAPVLFDRPGAVKVGCNIHDWMSGVILVAPTPHFAMTDERGEFVLADLPGGGTYKLAAWHERSRTKVENTFRDVALSGETTSVEFTLEVGDGGGRVPVHGARGYP